MRGLSRRGLLPLVLALACGEAKGPGPAAGDDTGGAGDDTGEAVDCALALSITLGADRVVPGGEGVALALSSEPEIPHLAAIAWETTHGEVQGEREQVTWVVAGDEAVHTDEAGGVTATVTSPGCAPASVRVEAVVGHPESDRVVVLYNAAVAGSEDVARAYAALHGLDEAQLCALPADDDTTLHSEELAAVRDALVACLGAVGPQVHYLVPVYGVPYKVSGRIDDLAGSGTKVTTSLDALLAFGARATSYTQAVYSPVYRDGDSLAGDYAPWVPFGELRQTLSQPFYLVTRLEGVDAAAAIDLVDRAGAAQALADAGALAGTVYVDGRYGDTPPETDDFGSYESGEWNMWGTRTIFTEVGLYDVVWDGNNAEFGTAPAPLSCPDALFYAGWYSFNHYNDAFTWAPGAIGGHLDSCSACTLRGGPSWSSNALERGITATYGAVGEPYVAGMPEYDQLHLYLLQGANFAEAAYESTVVGAWMMTFVGDPLYRPFPGGVD